MSGGRRRRWLRILLLGVGVLVVAGGAALLALRVKWRGDLREAVERFEQEVGSLDPANLPPPKVAASDNAASWLEAAGAALVLDEEEWRALSVQRAPLAEWTPDPVAAARALGGAHPEVLSLLARAVPLEASSFGARYVPDPVPIDGASIGAPRRVPDPVVDLLPQIRLAHFVRLSVGLALLDGDCGLAADRIAVAARQVRALFAERMLLYGLIGSSAHRALVDDAVDLAARCRETLPLESALEALERVEREAFPADEVLRGEGVSSLAQMGGLLEREAGWLRALFREHRLALQAGLINHWREMVLAARGGAPALCEFSERQRERVERPRNTVEIITAMLTPNLVDGTEKMILREASGRAARAALRLRIAGLRDGAYPDAGKLPEELRAPTSSLVEALVVTRLDGGGLSVGYPEALADWRERHSQPMPEPRLVLTLPPLTSGPSTR
ncbi:MAG TPA: hypothetical protein VMV46_17295 [Thermoanaerobaculia bacterium]|nr:hypothetical protein [Thermoanaerobaculia bacterium]